MSDHVQHIKSVTTDEAGDDIDASNPCVVRMIHYFNTTAASASAYLQVFDKPIADVTVGTTAPVAYFGMSADWDSVITFPGSGWRVGGTGLSVAVTTTPTGNDAGDGIVTIGYGN